MVWICAQKGYWIYLTKDVEDGVSRQELNRKTTEKVH